MRQRYFLKNNKIDDKLKFQLTKVLRCKTGDKMEFCFDNKCYLVSLTFSSKDVTYEIIEEIKRQKNKYKIDLLQGLPNKEKKLEFILKYNTLFGVNDIYFLKFNRSIDLKISKNRYDRYHEIVKEAAEINHRDNVPNFYFIDKLNEIKYLNYDLIILADEEEQNTNLYDLFDKEYKNILVIIGPEGGITDIERNYFLEQGAKKITLGKNILTTESAALPILSYIKLKK